MGIYGYINPYYEVDDHPLLYGNNGTLDPGTFNDPWFGAPHFPWRLGPLQLFNPRDDEIIDLNGIVDHAGQQDVPTEPRVFYKGSTRGVNMKPTNGTNGRCTHMKTHKLIPPFM